MNSVIPSDAAAFALGRSLYLPWVQGTVPAGFPSPATDFAIKRHDLNELLITHPAATFIWEIRGLSMVELGIADRALVVVNRALTPAHQDIVVAELDGDFTCKQLYKRNGMIQLRAGNPTFPTIFLKEGQVLIICGVVTAAIMRFR